MEIPSNYKLHIFSFLLFIHIVNSAILVPPYFNLVVNRKIQATATCGEGVAEPEEFCILTGASVTDISSGARGIVKQGQFCDVCDPKNESKSYPITNAIDGTHKWWQSPPLSRSLDYNEVNVTIDLNQEFHVAYVYITMGNSPRPAVWVLEKSTDYGNTYSPWQYFAEHPSECQNVFKTEANKQVDFDDEIVCTTVYSKAIPLEGGEILVSLVNNRPSSRNFTNSDKLQEWTRATNVRLRLLRTKSLQGHLMGLTRQDPSVTRRYFYSIRDISIGGRCVCNGHAVDCETENPESYKQVCSCEHNTCGDHCEKCCEGFVQKKWRQNRENDEFQCEPCQCYGHSESCHYDEEVDKKKLSIDIHGHYSGGGVCDNCQHNTDGINCDKCKPGYYRPNDVDPSDEDACRPCQCDLKFSTGKCAESTGECECKENYIGVGCTQCAVGYTRYPDCEPCKCNVYGRADNACEDEVCNCKDGYAQPHCDSCDTNYYGFPNCTVCDCDADGTENWNCDKVTGQCRCKTGFTGKRCDECQAGYYGDNICEACECSDEGVTSEICSKEDGKCLCKPNFTGAKCDECAPGHYNYPFCLPCDCNLEGSQGENCTYFGVKQCLCKEGRGGPSCDQCAPGFYQFPDCLPCECNEPGSTGQSCDLKTGKCRCKPNFSGEKCEECAANLFNFPTCEECNCNPIGVQPQFAGCDKKLRNVTSICPCKKHVTGKQCDKCKDHYFGLGKDIENGCTSCACTREGTLNELENCDPLSGKCLCKHFVDTRSCSECQAGSYFLQRSNIFGCEPCECRIGSSLNNYCDKESGGCSCLPNIVGDKCDEADNGYYIPDLHHLKYEIEDGYTSNRNNVRYEFDYEAFPNFSWKGFVRFKELENQVSQDINIEKAGSYRMILRYMSKNPDLTELLITVKEQGSQDEQSTTMLLSSAFNPEFATVTRNQVNAVTFELENTGKYTVTFKTTSNEVYIDYFVLLPSDYYEPSLLKKNVEKVCESNGEQPCTRNTYIQIDSFTAKVLADEPKHESRKVNLETIGNVELTAKKPVYLVPVDENLDIKIELKFPRSNNYILLVEYYNTKEATNVDVSVEHTEDKTISQDGTVYLYKCTYDTLCRQIILSKDSHEPLIVVGMHKAEINLRADKNGDVYVYRVIAVPKERFDINYIKMAPKCILKNKVCLPIEYTNMPDLIKEELHSGIPDERADLTTNIINGKRLEIDNKDANLVYLNDYYKSIKFPLLKNGFKAGNNQGYVIVIHYYQPNHPIVNVSVNIDELYKGYFQAPFCPSISGCRSIVVFENNNEVFDYEKAKSVTIQLVSDDKDIWLNYALVGPDTTTTPVLMKNAPIDLISDFITECASQHFSINIGVSKFCDDSVFSLSSKYNYGAKPCGCSTEGSKNHNCEAIGGQCECKENVIGRQCIKCKPGYYGYPDCKKCDCPGRSCDDKTGKCLCPANVIQNDDCNVCVPGYYGFHPEHGCVACDCNKEGTLSSKSNLCDSKTGQCQCRDNVGGLGCEKCKPGFYAYPACLPCTCNINGTTENICDAYGSCSCKDNLHDPHCEFCVDGTFNLEARNPKGCTKCFCFRQTERCDSSSYVFKTVQDMSSDAWKTNKNSGVEISKIESGGLKLSVNKDALNELDEPVYWVAPSEYLGRKVYSYGGTLRYTLLYRSTEIKGQTLASPDVILDGEGMSIAYRSLKQPANGESFTNSVDLIESQFSHVSNGAAVTREQLMVILNNLSSLKIRASSHSISFDSAELHSVQLDVGVRKEDDPDMETDPDNDQMRPAKSVEKCECPAAYRGLSCESCQPGYYKLKGTKTGSFTCVPCNCNGRADTCNEETGECINCRDDTEGKHCDKCKSGFYNSGGDNYLYCLKCPCPGPAKNFAHNCTALADQTVQCNCQKGYTGQYCSSCAAGYYGNPSLPIESDEGKCLPCNCNGNIDLTDIRACDQTTGKCLKCLRNTVGDNCERCKDWHYGDPIVTKNCLECKCDKCGSELCDAATGSCVCKPNVKGVNCNTCAENTWGFNSCEGCKECNCNPVGSIQSQCDTVTGNCFCKPGVTGKHCDMCEPDYWNFTSSGCQPCNCEKYGVQSGMSGISCNNKTGDCKCIPGVKGKYCDECDDRWILVKHKGCIQCDTCVHTLLDDAEELIKIADGIENRNSSLAVKAYNRLTQLEEVYAQLNSLATKQAIEEAPLMQLKKRLLKISEQQIPDLTYIPYDIDDKMKGFNETLREAIKFNDEISTLRVNLEEIIKLITTLQSLKEAPDVSDEEVEYFRNSINGILNQKFNETVQKLSDSLKNVAEDKNEADSIISKYNSQINELETINNKSNYIESSINELKGYIEKAKNIEKFKEKDVTFKAYIENFDRLRNESNFTKDNTTATLNSINNIIKNLNEGLNNAKTELDDLENTVGSLDSVQVNHNSKIKELEDKLNAAREKSNSLLKMSNEWERRIKNSQAGLEAFEIANIYDTIALTLNSAYNKSKDVLENYEKANERLNNYLNEFENLKERNENYSNKLRQLEEEQKNAEEKYAELQKRHDQLDNSLVTLNKDVENIEKWVNKTQQSENTLNEIGKSLAAQENELKQSQETATRLKTTIQTIESLKNKNNEDGTLENLSNAKLMNQSIDSLVELNSGINDRISKISNHYRSLDDKLDEVNEIINNLKLLIESTRNIANEIKVAVKFKNSSFIKLRNAPVFMQSITTVGSLYLKTTDTNAPISVIYNRNNPNAYLSLYLKNGAPHLQYRLSDKAVSNVISSSEVINDGSWYRLEVERVGRQAKLKVFNEKDLLIADEQKQSNDDNVVFDIDSMNANFYLGQFKFPDDKVPLELQSALTYNGAFRNQFEGAIDTVSINRHSFGLWNHDDANDIDGEIKRANDKESSLTNSKAPVYFNEKSFLCTDKKVIRQMKQSKKFDITLKFKTANPNGILWYGRDDKDKINLLIYLEDGNVVVDLLSLRENNRRIILNDGNNDEWNSEYKLNDNKFHFVHVSVVFDSSRKATITVSEKEIKDSASGEKEISRITRPLDAKGFGPSHVCVGGVPSSYNEPQDLPKNSFVGCFEYYYSKNIDINNDRTYIQQELLKVNTTASGIETKCPDVIDQCSFHNSQKPVYVSFDVGSFEDQATFGLSFIPRFSNGTLLFIRQRELQEGDAINYIHLYLENLYLNLVVKNTKTSVKLQSKSTVNYNDLNHVFVVKNDGEFTLNVNDAINKDDLSDKNRIFTNSDLYIGGVPETERTGISDKFSNFQGCIVDLVFKDKQLKFQNVKERSKDALGFSKCFIPPVESIILNNDNKPLFKLLSDKLQTKYSLVKDEICSLNKQYDQTMTKPVGTRFGLTKNSRIEVLDDNVDRFNSFISLKFRTILSDGLIFYATDASFEKYITLWLQNGYLNFAFGTSETYTHIVSKRQYNDGRYHTLIATRQRLEGTLRILDKSNSTLFELLQDKSLNDDVESFNIIGPYYIGGLSEDVLVKIPEKQKAIINVDPYIGCMSDFIIGNKKIEPLKNRLKRIDLMNCSNTHESGVFFTGKSQASHASLISQISMKDSFELEMDLKSRTKDGLILYIGPKELANKDYITLELVNGELLYQIYFGGMKYSVKYTPKEANNELCNSNWIHIKIKKSTSGKIILYIKDKEIVSNNVDLLASSSRFNTLYLGGLPSFDLYSKVSLTKEPFVGCIRDLTISQGVMKTRKILLDLKLEEDVLNYCPLK